MGNLLLKYQKNKFSFFLLCDIISVGSTGGIMINIENSFSFHNGDIIVIGCSAGPDSMALVDMLLKIREKYNLFLIIAHVNHNVRKESFEEADFIEKYCEDNNLIFESMIIEQYGDDNFHNEARNIRYSFFH